MHSWDGRMVCGHPLWQNSGLVVERNNWDLYVSRAATRPLIWHVIGMWLTDGRTDGWTVTKSYCNYLVDKHKTTAMIRLCKSCSVPAALGHVLYTTDQWPLPSNHWPVTCWTQRSIELIVVMTNESDIVFVDAEHHSTGLIGSVLGSMGSMLWYSHWWLQRCVEDTNTTRQNSYDQLLRDISISHAVVSPVL